MSADSPGRREVAYRLFADEYDDATLSYSESDEERAPNYVVTPTGARVNRLFIVGVLTEVTQVGDDILRARVSDPTGVFVLYAGQYQPDEQAFLERTEPPAFVAVTGKARTFQPDDSEQVYTSVRPESINLVDGATRDRWLVQTAEQTLRRVDHAARALAAGDSGEQLHEELSDVDPALADGISRALAHYGTTAAYLDRVRTMALDVAGTVAGDRDSVRGLVTAPDEPGDVTPADLLGTVPDSVGTASPTGQADVSGSDPAPASETDDSEGSETDDSEGSETADDPGEFTLDEETRREIETEYGTDFQSGSEVDDPGEADIDPPEPEPVTDVEPAEGETDGTDTLEPDVGAPDPETAGTAGATETDELVAETDELVTETDDSVTETDDSVAETEAASAETASESDSSATETAETASEESGAPEVDVDPQEAVLAVMNDLDDGDGADREAVVSETSKRHGLSAEEVTDAIQSALMDGRCYEPTDSSLKPI